MNIYLFGKSKNKVNFIVRTAVLLALTISFQLLSSLLGQQLITGSVVNLFLLTNTILVGLIGSSIIAIFTPLIGSLIGLVPNMILVPFIGVSNLIYVFLFSIIYKYVSKIVDKKILKILLLILGIILCAFVKFSFMYYFEYMLIVPLIFGIVPNMLKIVFGINQLFTSLIGGALFIILYKPINMIKS